MVYKSGFLPKIFGIFFVAETFTGLLSVIIHFLFPDTSLELNLMWIGAITEFTFMFWLLIRGINEARVMEGKYIGKVIGF